MTNRLSATQYDQYTIEDIDSLLKEAERSRLALLSILEDQKLSEKALIESEERFRLLVNGVKDYAIFMLDPNGSVVSWNDGAWRINGYAPEEIIGQSFARFYTAEDVLAGKPKQELEKAKQRGAASTEGWRVRKDGTKFWASTVLSPLRDDHGVLRGFAKITQDMTERKIADELSEAINRINVAINSTFDFDEIVERVVVASAKALAVDAAGLALREDNYWVMKYVHNLPDLLIGCKFSDKQFKISAQAAQTRQPVIGDTSAIQQGLDSELVLGYGIKSFLEVPILSKDEVIGVISFYHCNNAGSFSPLHSDFATKLAASLALAIENCRLYNSARQIAKDKAQVLETLAEGIVLLDRDCIITFANFSTERILGKDRNCLIGCSAVEKAGNIFFAEGEQVKPENHPCIQVMQTGQALYGLEVSVFHPEKEQVHISLNISPLSDHMGMVTGVVVSFADVSERKYMEAELRKHRESLEHLVEERTRDLASANQQLRHEIAERKRAEKELRLSEERFSKAFYCSPNMMTISTFDDGCYLEVNEAFLKSTQYLREDLIGCGFKQSNIFSDPEDRQYIKKLLLKNEQIANLETKFRTKHGEERDALLSAEVIEVNSERSILIVSRDVTEQKRLEKEVARLDQLNLIGEMAAGFGHEIRNPMTTARGFMQMLAGKKECQKYKEQLNLVIEELDRANQIISEYLSMAKNKSIELVRIDLNEVVQALFPLIQADAMVNDKQVKLALKDIPQLLLDENEVRQLILNLSRNGLESMTASGVLTIKTFAEGNDIVLAVQDQGKGIDPNFIDKLGTPFFTTKEDGTGLGLAICYSIAGRHNATIRFETGESGTTFFVRFKEELL